jgi:prepilin-type processing-associated H-X9-DG protein
MKIDDDWQEQIQTQAATDYPGPPEDERICQAVLLSIPVSYPYAAHATSNMAQFADMSRGLATERWFLPDRVTWDQQRAIDAGCPAWEGFGEPSDPSNVLGIVPLDGDVDAVEFSGWHSSFNQGEVNDSYPRMSEGVERFFITDINNPAGAAQAQSTIAVMWDAWGGSVASQIAGSAVGTDSGITKTNHVPGGSNVLYMDGHVEFVRLGSKTPLVTEVETTITNFNPAVLAATRAGGMG